MIFSFYYPGNLKLAAIWSGIKRSVAYLLFLFTAMMAHGQTKSTGGVTTSGSQAGVYMPPIFDENHPLTPYGRYHQTISAIVGKAWEVAVAAQNPPIPKGSVKILVKLDPTGKVAGTKVLSTGNDHLAMVGLAILTVTTLPPVPHDLAPMIRNGTLSIVFQFSVY